MNPVDKIIVDIVEQRTVTRLFPLFHLLPLNAITFSITRSLVSGQTHFVVAFDFFRFSSQSERSVMRDRWTT